MLARSTHLNSHLNSLLIGTLTPPAYSFAFDKVTDKARDKVGCKSARWYNHPHTPYSTRLIFAVISRCRDHHLLPVNPVILSKNSFRGRGRKPTHQLPCCFRQRLPTIFQRMARGRSARTPAFVAIITDTCYPQTPTPSARRRPCPVAKMRNAG